MFVFFFFKQKTAYEMRISDWSSDVCSSDLQFRKDVGIGPFPCAKFLMVGFDVHVIIGAGEAGKKPDLPLPAILSVPYFADQFIRQIIIMLFLRPRQELDMPFSNAGFLTQFAKRCSLRFFALVNAALRHLHGTGPGI